MARVRMFFGLTLGIVTGVFLFTLWSRAATPAIAREMLVASFASDMRRVVYEWNPSDPRPEADRERALFDFLANMELGFLAPPVGLNLLLASSRLKRPVAEVARATLPLLGVMFLGVLLITYYPPLTTWLPGLFPTSARWTPP